MRPKGQIFDLKRFRQDHKVSQKEIAEAIGRPQSFLSAIEHGKRSAPADMLNDLCRIYDVDNISDYLSDRDENVEESICSIEDVRNAVVNSPHSLFILDSGGKKKEVPAEFLQQILQITDKEQKEEKENNNTHDNVSQLVRLLSAADARYAEAESRIKELEKQVQDLKAQLSSKN